MEHLINELKTSMVAIQALSIYDYQQHKFIFEDKGLPNVTFLTTMAKENCFEESSFLYLETDDKHFFLRIHPGKQILAIVQLDTEKTYNKVILEHKCASMLEEVSTS
ncbi:MAG: hypothetical protein AAFO69_06480 [Bacteroidota bacterium]